MPKLIKTIMIIVAILIILPYMLLQIYGLINQMKYEGDIGFLNETWQLEIPDENYQVLYNTKSKDAFFGEGERFYLFQFTESLSQQLSWQLSELSNTEVYFQEIQKTLTLTLKQQYLPDFNLETPAMVYSLTSETGSRIHLIYFDELLLGETNYSYILYVLEILV